MALVKSILKNSLLSIFNTMKNSSDSDPSFFANGLASSVVTYVASGAVSTTDAGTVTGGEFTGAGTGALVLSSAPCAQEIISACNYMYAHREDESFSGEAYLAEKLSSALKEQAESGMVTTTVTGTLTPPSGTPVTYGGIATGSISVSNTSLTSKLKDLFSRMYNNRESDTYNGDEDFADTLASQIDSMYKSGSITTDGEGNILGSSGSGTIS